MATVGGPQFIPTNLRTNRAPPGAGLGIEGASMGAFEVVQQRRLAKEAPKQDAKFKENVEATEAKYGFSPVEKAQGELFTAARDMYETWGMDARATKITDLKAQVAQAKGTSNADQLQQQLDTATAEYAKDKQTIDNLAAASEKNTPDKLTKAGADEQVMGLTAAYGFYQEQYKIASGMDLEVRAKEMKKWEDKARAVENSYYSMSELADVTHPSKKERLGNFFYNGAQEVLGRAVKSIDKNVFADMPERYRLGMNPKARGFLEGKLRNEMAFRKGRSEAGDPTGTLTKAEALFERIRTGDLTAVAEARAETNRWLADDRLRIIQEANPQPAHTQAEAVSVSSNDTLRTTQSQEQARREAEERARAAAAEQEKYVIEQGPDALDQLIKAHAPLDGNEADIIAHMANLWGKDNMSPDAERFIRAGVQTHGRIELGRRVMEANSLAQQLKLSPDKQAQLNAAAPDKKVDLSKFAMALAGISMIAGSSQNQETGVGAASAI